VDTDTLPDGFAVLDSIAEAQQRPPWETDTLTDIALIEDRTQTLPRGIPRYQDPYSEPKPPRSPRRETARHRVIVTLLLVSALAALYGFQHLLWPASPAPHGAFQEAWSWMGLLWAASFVPAVFEFTGLYLWRAPSAPPQRTGYEVCYRVVSKGINTEALTETIEGIRREMNAMPLFPYRIEVLLDVKKDAGGLPPEDGRLRYLIVPEGYQTPNGTKAKARALNYALEEGVSSLPYRAWIVHCDEETQPTASGITGIAAAIAEEEALAARNTAYVPRIGQGTITYHRDWAEHPFFTLSDCIRTGSDLGRLYLSMMIGVPLFGLHGSFIVIRNDVEKSMMFDVGPVGSLTEDAWQGTKWMDRGYRCRWIEGYMAEQCTFRVRDFIKQRRRWFCGMNRTARLAPVRWRWRAVLSVSMLAWASAPFAWLYTVGHLVHGGYISPEVRFLANFSLAVYVATTIIGLRVNLKAHGKTKVREKIGWTLTWLGCLVAFSLMETVAVAYAIARPAKGFDVVRK
jgi:beta-1,4-mannosyltransferase